MSELKSHYSVEALVEAGRLDRQDAIVSAPMDFRQLLWHVGNDGRFAPSLLEVHELDAQGQLQEAAPCQWDNGVVSWIAQGALPAGSRRRYRIGFDSDDAPVLKKESSPAYRKLVIITDLGKELQISQNQIDLARYQYRDVWKPFFYPLNGPNGSVVRGIGAEHPHQHGLYIAYGSEDCLGVNMWSELPYLLPPRGPAGKMVHDTFEVIEYGYVFGHFRQRLTYIKPDGYPFARELRTVRFYAPTPTTRIVDWTLRLEEPQDTGNRRVALACRVADSMRTRDETNVNYDGLWGELRENPGRLENSEGGIGEPASRGRRLQWLDFSGPVEDGWNGIALFEHPDNPGEDGVFSCREYGLFLIGCPYPTERTTRDGAATLRFRAFIHAGDATEGRVAQAYADYAFPCRVVVGAEIQRKEERT
jgi:hypothetical protein